MNLAYKLTAIFIFSIALPACSTNKVQLTYNSTSATRLSGAEAVVSQVIVQDLRGTASDWLGAIRGGFGNRLKTLLTDRPVKDVVQTAFVKGLEARGMLAQAEAGQIELFVDVRKFDCSQYVRREAHAIFDVSLNDLETGRTVYQKLVQVDRTSGGGLAVDTGLFGSVEDLRAVANETLEAAINQTLNDRGFRAALKQP